MYVFPPCSWGNSQASPLPLLETAEKQMTPNFPLLIKMLNRVKMPSHLGVFVPLVNSEPRRGQFNGSSLNPNVIKFPNVINPESLMETFSFLLISMWKKKKAPRLGALPFYNQITMATGSWSLESLVTQGGATRRSPAPQCSPPGQA